MIENNIIDVNVDLEVENDHLSNDSAPLESEKIETKGLKLRKSTKERLNSLQNKYGDAESMVVALLNQYEAFNIESSEKYSDRKAEIEKFNYLLESMKASYLNSLEMAAYLEEKYVEKFAIEIKANEKIINSLQKENIKLKESYISIEKELEKKDGEVTAVKDSFSRVNLALTMVEKELNEKSETIQNAQKHIDTLTEVSNEAQRYKGEKESLLKEIDELKEKLIKMSLLEAECESYKKEILRLRDENNHLKGEINSNKVYSNELNVKIQDILTSSAKEINHIKDNFNKSIFQLELEKNKNIMENNVIVGSLKEEIYKLELKLLQK